MRRYRGGRRRQAPVRHGTARGPSDRLIEIDQIADVRRAQLVA